MAQITIEMEDNYFPKIVRYLKQFLKDELTIVSYSKTDESGEIVNKFFNNLSIQEFITQFPEEINYIDTSNISTEEILKKGINYLTNTLNAQEYNMYYSGWEIDSKFWVIDDGRKFTTNHNCLIEFTEEDFNKYKYDLKMYLELIGNL